MNIRRVVPDIASARFEESRKFYTEFFGFNVAMDMGWIVTFVSPSNPTAQINLLRGSPGLLPHPQLAISIEVEDVAALHAQAVERGLKIVYPLTDEPWRVRRFGVEDPNGVIINVMNHLK
jgi:predicted enzyme related to lactoylglutathione lyase